MKLLPLNCLDCDHALTPENIHRVTFCERCNIPFYIGEEGIKRIEMQYKVVDTEVAEPSWQPFWIFQGKVQILKREQQGLVLHRKKTSEKFWDQVKRFYVPAWDLPVEEGREIGIRMLKQQPFCQVIPKPTGLTKMLPVTLSIEDAVKLLRFYIQTIEAQRDDRLKKLDYRLDVGEPELWALRL